MGWRRTTITCTTSSPLLNKLGTDRGRAVTAFPRWKGDKPGKDFVDWIRIVTSFTVKDYVRQQLGRASGGGDKAGEQLPSIKRLLNEFATSPAGRSPSARRVRR